MIDYSEYTGFKHTPADVVKDTIRARNGVQLTEGLFEETAQLPEKFDPLYTLREYEVNGKPSAYQIYMHSIDEADAAMKLVGSLSHWRKLCGLKWFLNGRKEIGFDGLNQWRRDMYLRDRTEAKQALIKLMKAGNVTAARALDKLAQEELKKTPESFSKSTGKSEPDGLEFLDNYRKS